MKLLLVYVFSDLFLNLLGGKGLGDVLTEVLTNPMFYALIAAALGGYLVWRWARHTGSPKDFVETEFIPVLKWTTITMLLVCGPVVIVFLYSESLYSEILPNADPVRPADRFTGVLERLPTEAVFYASISGLISLCMAWRWWQFFGLSKEFSGSENSKGGGRGLTPRDWLVALSLRKRSLSLRARSDMLLIGVFLLLFTGIYLILFILPGIQGTDALRAQRAQLAAFHFQFAETLQALVEGRRPIRVTTDEIKKIRGEASTESEILSEMITRDQVLIHQFTDEGQEQASQRLQMKDNERVTERALSRDGRNGVVIGNRGSVFVTTDGGQTWTTPDFARSNRNRATAIAVSSNGNSGVVVYRGGPAFMTTDGGQEWTTRSLDLDRHEWISDVALSSDGTTGVVAGRQGSVNVTTDGGQTWTTPDFARSNRNRVTAVAVSSNGNSGVVVYADGSVFMATDGGKEWTLRNLNLNSAEWITQVALSSDGMAGVALSDEGSVFVTKDRGQTWTTPDFARRRTGPATAVAVSNNGNLDVVVYRDGSAFFTTDGGQGSTFRNLDLKGSERIIQVALSGDGATGAALGSEGSVFVTKDRGQTWTTPGFGQGQEEWVTSVAVSVDGRTQTFTGIRRLVFMTSDDAQVRTDEIFMLRGLETATDVAVSSNGVGVFGGGRGSVFATTDGGQTWTPPDFTFNDGERVSLVAVSNDGKTALVIGNQGSIWVSTDGGQTWTPSNFAIGEGEPLLGAKLSSDGATGVVVGRLGSVYVTTDGGQTWTPIILTLRNNERVVELSFIASRGPRAEETKKSQTSDADGSGKFLAESFHVGSFVITTHMDEENNYVLKRYSELENWRKWSPVRVRNAMAGNSILRNSTIFLEVSDFSNTITAAEAETDGVQETTDDGGTISKFWDDLTVMRIATSTILFFLVQLLVRLYQYSLRLASFWESRADAILLRHSFSEKRSERFDDLVNALAPDTYDFKSMPRPPLDWLWRGRNRGPNVQL